MSRDGCAAGYEGHTAHLCCMPCSILYIGIGS
jgi:hypothetical protein